MKHILKRFSNQVEKDITNLYFLYNGNIININKKLKELLKKEGNIDEINILVNEYEKNENINLLKKSQEIICPICKELCLIDFNDYKINFQKCKNNHKFSNILFNEFNIFQQIDESKIICNNCNNNKNETNNNKFYKCCNCYINLCPLCKISHTKTHIILDYDIKYYYCNKHGERYISFNKEKNENLYNLYEYDKNNLFFYKIFKKNY